MKLVKIVRISLGGILLALAGAMVLSNPSPRDYERYATETLSVYLKDKVCSQAKAAPEWRSLLRGSCKTLVETSRPQIKQVVAVNTTRQNFLLFSIYQTDLALPEPLPSYQFATLGLFQNFLTYRAEKI
jgi:hypothetical protein